MVGCGPVWSGMVNFFKTLKKLIMASISPNRIPSFIEVVAYYFQARKNEGFAEWQIQQPSEFLSELGSKYFYLRNVNGLLARYDYRKKQFVDFIGKREWY